MGRILETAAAVYADTASDLHAAALKTDRPLALLAREDLERFESSLRSFFVGRRLLLLTGGLGSRVSGLSGRKVQSMLRARLLPPDVREL